LPRTASSVSELQAAIDGFKIQGGDQQGFPNNLFQVGGGRIPGVPAEVVIQGGGIFVNGYARTCASPTTTSRTTAGPTPARSGWERPTWPSPDKDNQNDNILIAHNRIVATAAPTWPAPSASLPAPRTMRSRQRHLRQLFGRVRRRHQPLRLQPRRQDPPQPHLL
jgi:hypothetical protein